MKLPQYWKARLLHRLVVMVAVSFASAVCIPLAKTHQAIAIITAGSLFTLALSSAVWELTDLMWIVFGRYLAETDTIRETIRDQATQATQQPTAAQGTMGPTIVRRTDDK